ncbi:hypothetical protein HDE_01359 [Halotydeus destructor]|nr:hypothetical protein HDE_01359 [Halotydeus destructor]
MKAIAVILICTVHCLAEKSNQRQSRGLIAAILSGLLPDLFTPVGLLGTNPLLAETLEKATEDHLCKRSVTVEEEPDVRALPAQDPDVPCIVYCMQKIHRGIGLDPHARYFNVTFPDSTPCFDGRTCLRGACSSRTAPETIVDELPDIDPPAVPVPVEAPAQRRRPRSADLE